MIKSIEIEDAKLRIQAGQYQFIEVQLPELATLEEAIELADQMKKKELENRYTCKHDFSEVYVAKSGNRYKECWNCGQQSYEDKEGNWSPWKMPMNKGAK